MYIFEGACIYLRGMFIFEGVCIYLRGHVYI